MARRDRRSIWSKENLVTIVAAVFMLLTLFGVQGSLQTLQARVNLLGQKVSVLNRIEQRIERLQDDVQDLAKVRNDILEAIDSAVRRPTTDGKRHPR